MSLIDNPLMQRTFQRFGLGDPRTNRSWKCPGHLGCYCPQNGEPHACSVCGEPTHPCKNDRTCNTGVCSTCSEWFNAHLTKAQLAGERIRNGLRWLEEEWYPTFNKGSKAIKKRGFYAYDEILAAPAAARESTG